MYAADFPTPTLALGYALSNGTFNDRLVVDRTQTTVSGNLVVGGNISGTLTSTIPTTSIADNSIVAAKLKGDADHFTVGTRLNGSPTTGDGGSYRVHYKWFPTSSAVLTGGIKWVYEVQSRLLTPAGYDGTNSLLNLTGVMHVHASNKLATGQGNAAYKTGYMRVYFWRVPHATSAQTQFMVMDKVSQNMEWFACSNGVTSQHSLFIDTDIDCRICITVDGAY